MSMIDKRLAQGDVGFEHSGRSFVLRRITDGPWRIVEADGRAIGWLDVLASSGEEGEPVYVGAPGADGEPEFEGSDWESIVRAVVNEVDGVQRDLHDVNPRAHVRGGIIGRERSTVDGLE